MNDMILGRFMKIHFFSLFERYITGIVPQCFPVPVESSPFNAALTEPRISRNMVANFPVVTPFHHPPSCRCYWIIKKLLFSGAQTKPDKK